MCTVSELRQATASTVAAVLVSGYAVAAGYPSPAQDYYDGTLDLNQHLIKDTTSTFIVRVAGDSMTGAGIFDGDELVVDRALTAQHGSVVIAIVDGELTVKTLHLDAQHEAAYLVPANPKYPRLRVPELSDFTIWGVVTYCLHRVKAG
ncbi:LexA family protein [Acaricomes phytoseiuli]|uniref:LexA family protein n=1 Tax=Acaricomes phytoseiuli TaxID=291968 RepID=UPI000477BE78|nr:translesion error-prone DNA polymerase V autoproteolytic subunit [Acaricomes phytoseiuli]